MLTGKSCKDVKLMTDEHRLVSSSDVVLGIIRFISDCSLLGNDI